MEPPDDEPTIAADLVRRIRAGDRQAEAVLVERYRRGLSFLLWRRTRDRALSEDLRQETLMLTLEKIRAGDPREPMKLRAFIYTTAINLARGYHRKRARRESAVLAADELPIAREVEPLDRILQKEKVDQVRRMVAALPLERDRQILSRLLFAEEDKEQIRTDLDLKPSRFNLVLCRALKRLRQLYKEKSRAPLPKGPMDKRLKGSQKEVVGQAEEPYPGGAGCNT